MKRYYPPENEIERLQQVIDTQGEYIALIERRVQSYASQFAIITAMEQAWAHWDDQGKPKGALRERLEHALQASGYELQTELWGDERERVPE